MTDPMPRRPWLALCPAVILTLAAMSCLLPGCKSPPAQPRERVRAQEDASAEKRASPEPAREIYLGEGGISHLVLERTADGALRAEGNLRSSDPETTFAAEIRQTSGTPWLILRSEDRALKTPFLVGCSLFVLTPDSDRPGDWRLIYFEGDVRERGDASPCHLTVPDDLTAEMGGPYLHRVDDSRIPDYFHLARSMDYPESEGPGKGATTSGTAELLRMAEGLVAARPGDLHVRVLLLDALLRQGLLERFRSEVEKGEADLAGRNEAAVRHAFREARRQVEAHRLLATGRNGLEAVTRLLAETHPPAGKFQLLSEILRYEDARSTVAALVRPGLARIIPGSYWTEQVEAKLARVRSEFLLLEGRRAEARTLAVGYYRAAQLYQHDYTLGAIRSLIGISLRHLLGVTLQTQAANAVQTPAEAAALWQALEYLNHYERPLGDFPYMPARYGRRNWKISPEQDARVRDGVASAIFQLVRLTLAVRWHQMTTGHLPASTDQLRAMFPNGLPADPFTSTPLRLMPAQAEVTVYSTGPDQRDDFGTLRYDPTNGTISGGDVFVRVPVEREYPFDPQGTRAESAADLLCQFPKGLPPDPFGGMEGRGYSVTGGPGPVTVFSFGPDADGPEAFRGKPDTTVVDYTPAVPYDPTNGVSSRGDIFLRLPQR